MAGKVVEGGESTLNVLLHPIVILNISDHFMRTKAVYGTAKRVMGIIAGQQRARTVEVMNTFEVAFTGDEDAVIDEKFYTERQKQFIQVYPTLDVIGWYSTGSIKPSISDLATHKQVTKWNESPLYLKLDPQVAPSVKDLPVKIYEVDSHSNFVDLSFKIDATPAESVTISHISKNTNTGDDAAARLQVHFSGLHGAVKMLSARVKIVFEYIASVKKGTTPATPAVMRQIASLCHRMPTLDTSSFQKEHMSEYNDAVLLAYLANVTRATQTLNDVVDRFNVGYDRHSRRRGMF